MKYHVNDRGEAGKCRADRGSCPFGGPEAHHALLEEARAAYETSMAEGQIANPTTSLDLATYRVDVDAPAADQIKFAEKKLLEAGDVASAHLSKMWNRETRRYADPLQGRFVHDQMHLQTLAMFDLGEASYFLKENDVPAAIAALEEVQGHLKDCGKAASAQMRSIWDPETKSYTDGPQANMLHALINGQAQSLNRVRFAIRELKKNLAP